MNCKHCGKPIVLAPSAAERAARYGGKPEDYTKLFEYHSQCALELRAQGTSELMARTRRDGPPSVALRVKPVALWARSRRR